MLRGLYNWTMAKAAHPRAPWWLAFFSFIESSFFPVPPHPLLGLMCLAEPRRAVRFALICTLASVAGGLFGYLIGLFLYETVGAWLLGVLGLEESFPRAACVVRQKGAMAVFISAGTPIPFKLMTITAGFVEMNIVQFTLAAAGGRALIFMTVGVLFRVYGAPIKRLIDKYLVWLTTLFVVLVVGGAITFTQLASGDQDRPDPSDRCAQATGIEQG